MRLRVLQQEVHMQEVEDGLRHGTMLVGGVLFHVEAFEVTAEGFWQGSASGRHELALEGLHELAGDPGPFDTIETDDGRQWVAVCYPFS